MNEKKFKQTFKPPVCNAPPWYNTIPKDIRDATIRKIRQETIEKYGYSMDECPKRKTCLTKQCIGRPLPWASETAKPYLEKLKATHTIKGDELYINNCDTCTIAKTCSSPCHQLNSFLNRHQDKEPNVVYQEDLEQHIVAYSVDSSPKALLGEANQIPWNCLTDNKATVVKKYLYEGKDFLTIAKELDLNNQSRAKYEFYSALTRLSEFAIMRKFLTEHKSELDNAQLEVLNGIYIDNKTLTEVAVERNISKQAVQQLLKRITTKYKLKWTVFVKKQNGKTIYNVPGMFK